MFRSGTHQSSLRLMSQKFASMDELFEALSHSAFRSKFRLSYADRTYAETRNDELLKKHARQILHDRIGSAHPKNDGKQTPYKGHPIFTAQHATGCCCRGCLYKWPCRTIVRQVLYRKNKRGKNRLGMPDKANPPGR